MGRIYRVVHDEFKPDNQRPNMLNQASSDLLQYLDHPNGWWRDNAQQIIIARNDISIAPGLIEIARGHQGPFSRKPGPLARIHALWTLEGLEAIDKPTLLQAFADPDPQVRKAAVWISEIFINKNDTEIIDMLALLRNDASPDVRVQVYLSLRTNGNPKAQQAVNELLTANQNNEMIQFSHTNYVEAKKTAEEEIKRTKKLKRC